MPSFVSKDQLHPLYLRVRRLLFIENVSDQSDGEILATRKLILLQIILAALGSLTWALSQSDSGLSKAPTLFGLMIGSQILALLGAIASGFRRRTTIEARNYPNQGIMLSIRTTVLIITFASMLSVLFLSLFRWFWILDPPHSTDTMTIVNFVLPLSVLIVAALMVGTSGLDVVHHYVLRIILCWKGLIPRRYVEFLDFAVSLIFLRKVGGGYVFLHRLVLEHFANMSKQVEQPKPF
jgi:hypothetical protein